MKAGETLIELDSARWRSSRRQGATREGRGATRTGHRDTNRYTDLVARSATRCSISTTPRRPARAPGGDPRRQGGDRKCRCAGLVHDRRADFRTRRRRRHQGGQHRQGVGQQRLRHIRDDQPDFADLCDLLGAASASAGVARGHGQWRPSWRRRRDRRRAPRETRPARQFGRSDHRTILAHAIFDNSDETLWPGQLCNLTLTLRTEPNTVVVPREAIQIGQDGNFVFTIVDGAAHVQPVEFSAPRTAKPS